MNTRGISIFAQTLILLVASLIATQVVVIALIIALPQPRPQFVGMADIAATLSGKPIERRNHRNRASDEVPLTIRILALPPVPTTTMISNTALSVDLAERIGVPVARVRLAFKPDQSGLFPFAKRKPGEVVPMRRGEALFFNRVLAAYDTGRGWRSIQTAEPPVLSEWQSRLIILFGAALLALLPSAWFFARRLSNPIRRFAAAADQLGRDAERPSIAIEGPRELRTTAHALNAMQTRISNYVTERTAMIGAIAHDLRTPLARIAFRIEGADDSIRVPVQGDIEQMRDMISATLDFVKGASQTKKRVAIDLIQLLTELAEKSVQMGRDVRLNSSSPVAIVGDRISLQRLFQNLIDNALAFGGSARLDVTVEGNLASISVADEGPGLSEALLESVFDPFTRGEPSRNRETGGVGLGLTIARMIASDHGGTLKLSNRQEGGLIALTSLPI
jgi:two-component system, OmpR family, sensor kinase